MYRGLAAVGPGLRPWGGEFSGGAGFTAMGPGIFRWCGEKAWIFALHIQIQRMLPYSATELNCAQLHRRKMVLAY